MTSYFHNRDGQKFTKEDMQASLDRRNKQKQKKGKRPVIVKVG